MKKLLVLFAVLFSTSVFAQGSYMGILGTYNMVDSTDVDSSMGGEVYGGLQVMPDLFAEAYFGYNIYDVTGFDLTSMNFGAKVGTKFADYFVFKAGAGIVRSTVDSGGLSSSSNDIEIVGNAGAEIPLEGLYLVVLGNFSRVLDSSAYNTYGLSAGVKFTF